MRVVIWGAGKAGQHLLSQIKEKADNIQVECFIDGNPKSDYIADIHVRKPDEVIGILQPDAYFLAAGSQKANMYMVNTLTSRGITDIYMLHDIAGKNRLKVFDENGNINSRMLRKLRFDKNRPTLVYFEMPIVDNCNMNCNGCVFGIINSSDKAYVPFETVRKDLLRIHELFYDIPWIRILGGGANAASATI